ncbi:UNVERIFIED_CONTAM: hypothetical protein Sangu_2890100 [Sesamum angustifolium]|uniref:Uncharacterized protein n=1 Tax=Sesamum angustifolium TaxID=2727405 RepID=A0AAW2IP77_9LAMI
MLALNKHLLEACWGPPKVYSRHLKGVFRVPRRHGNLMGGVGPGGLTLGTKATERLQTMRKVAPRIAGYQGQHFSCEWVIEVSTLRPRDPTHGTRYWVLVGRGATRHCGQIVKPCRKARRHVGHAVGDHCEMSAY